MVDHQEGRTMSSSVTSASTHTPVALPARNVAAPPTISPEAAAALSIGAGIPAIPRPAAQDLEGWRRAIEASIAMWEPIAAEMLANSRCSLETRAIAGVSTHVCSPSKKGSGRCRYLYIHGGAFVFGAGRFAMATGARACDALDLVTVSVDYRMPPDHPFPAALEDCLAVYQALLADAPERKIVVGGSSAGGNLAAALTLLIRDRGLPSPAAVVLLTPEVDLTESGDTFRTNEWLDVTLKRGLPECNALYAAGRDLKDPYLSPLFADFGRGFPPTLIQSGTRDLFLSNSVLMHRKLRRAGVQAELHVWEAMPHGGFGFGSVPENDEINDEIRHFIARHG
jgi:epsilon-lactone hydrolase